MSANTITMPGTKKFIIPEVVTPQIYHAFQSHPAFIASLFKPELLASLNAVRAAFGPTIINTWHRTSGGKGGHQYRGLRPLDCSIGALRSQHKLGAAIDCHFSKTTAEEARQYIVDNPAKFPHITAIEGQVNWLHFDVRTATWQGVKVFNP
jgi:hypothetical protein